MSGFIPDGFDFNNASFILVSEHGYAGNAVEWEALDNVIQNTLIFGCFLLRKPFI